MAQSKEEQVPARPLFCYFDEIDSILIDEARTPLIISGPSAECRQMYDELKDDVAHLVRTSAICAINLRPMRKVLEKLGSLRRTAKSENSPKKKKRGKKKPSQTLAGQQRHSAQQNPQADPRKSRLAQPKSTNGIPITTATNKEEKARDALLSSSSLSMNEATNMS